MLFVFRPYIKSYFLQKFTRKFRLISTKIIKSISLFLFVLYLISFIYLTHWIISFSWLLVWTDSSYFSKTFILVYISVLLDGIIIFILCPLSSLDWGFRFFFIEIDCNIIFTVLYWSVFRLATLRISSM